MTPTNGNDVGRLMTYYSAFVGM